MAEKGRITWTLHLKSPLQQGVLFYVHKLCPHHMYEIVYGTHKHIDTLGS